MKIKNILLAAAGLFAVLSVQAQQTYTATYVDLKHTPAALYEPTVKTEKSSIGIVVMHSNQNYMSFLANGELASRGYTVLALEAPSGEMQSDKWIAEGKGVDYLKAKAGISKVVLLGHSGGATTTTAYQLIAEQGAEVLKDKIYNEYKLPQLTPADGVMLLDANYGNGIMTLLSLDPNVQDETTGMNIHETLNLADPSKGYGGDAGSHYTPEFIKQYFTAQAERMDRLTAGAQQRLELIKAGKGRFVDDEPFLAPGGAQPKFNNRLVPQDLSLLSHTHQSWPLIHGDGSVTHEVVHCLRGAMGYRSGSNRMGNTIDTTVRGFLSGLALRTDKEKLMIYEDRIEGIDWTSNINNGIGNAQGITVPLLTMGMTGSYEYIAAEWIYNASPAQDKTCAFVEGAGHMFYPEDQKYGDTVKALFDYVDQWLSTPGRFL